MRVVAGRFKGHRLKTLDGTKTRPTGDKVKEALFHSLGPYFDGGYVLDLFAGSGGLGIEALSRGMDHVVFVDLNPKAIQMIKANIQQLNLTDSCEIYRNDAFRAIKAAGKRDKRFDYVFLDPPYQQVSFNKLMDALHENEVLNEGAIIICEHPHEEEISEPIYPFAKINEIKHSSLTRTTIYRYK